MKKASCPVLVVIVLLTANAQPGYAKGHGQFPFRGGVWIGPGWGGWDPWWWGFPANPYYYLYYESEPPVVVQEQPQGYVQGYFQPIPQPEEQYYWYFCPDSKTYFPYVKQCPKGWLRVLPPQPPLDWRE